LAGYACVLAAVWVGGFAEAQTPSSPLPTPADFAPSPIPLPGSKSGLQKQLAGLLRRLEAVQSADVLLTGQSPADLSAKVLLRLSPRLPDSYLLDTIVSLLTDTVPGLSPQRITIADARGVVLYQAGEAQVAPPSSEVRRSALLWLLTALVLAASGSVWVARRVRTTSSAGAWDFLAKANDAALQRTLAGERPEIAGLLLTQLPPSAAKRLRRVLAREGLAPVLPAQPPEGAVIEIVARSLRAKLGTPGGQ
jgi:hypothetical protein